MANHKSSEKRARQDIKKTLVNKINLTKTRTTIKKVQEAVTAGDKALATTALQDAQSQLRKLAKTGVIKANTAARKTSRLAIQINTLN